MFSSSVLPWLLESSEPWTRYRAWRDLLGRPESDADVQSARAEMLAHPQVRSLMTRATNWGSVPLKRHNDAAHSLYALTTLADFGVRTDDLGMAEILSGVLAHQSAEGVFQTPVSVPEAFGGSGQDEWAWMACDAPTLLYVLLAMGLHQDERVIRAAAHLVGLVDENGYRCVVAPQLGRFRGPGRKQDPCPIANVYALKALALMDDERHNPAAQRAADMLLWHWQHRAGTKFYLFGIGSDFGKLKYPFIWYDLLHVVHVLSKFTFVYDDKRFQEMARALFVQADADGCYTAGSMYQFWKGWSFADKKHPSPWLTLLVWRIQKCLVDIFP